MSNPSATELPLATPVVRERWLLHVGLFVATFGFVLGSHWLGSGNLRDGLMFAASLLSILTCHEFGHYFLGRRHGVSISPPYFIPFPLGIGTLGAVIRIRSPIPTKNALVDIGAAGPIAGMVIAVPLLLWGTAHGKLVPVHYVTGMHWPGRASVLSLAMAFWHALTGPAGGFRAALHALANQGLGGDNPEGWSGDSLLSWAAMRFFWGAPPPGTDLSLHPIGEAAWWGCLVTMLNLLPIGQLDGGHVAYALLGERARKLGSLVHVGMLGLILFGSIWVTPWLLLTRYLVGVKHPPVTDDRPPLSTARIAIAVLSLLLLVLTFIPVPLEVRGGP